jgi:hypothetical protein
MKQAAITESLTKNKDAILRAYKRVRDEFLDRELPSATPAAGVAARADFVIREERFRAFQRKELRLPSNPDEIKKVFESAANQAKSLDVAYRKIWSYKDATWTLAPYLRSGDVFYEFAQKLVKAADNPPENLKKVAKMTCKANPEDCGLVERRFKDTVHRFVTPVAGVASVGRGTRSAQISLRWAGPPLGDTLNP